MEKDGSILRGKKINLWCKTKNQVLKLYSGSFSHWLFKCFYFYVLSYFSCVWLFANPWTVACQAPLSMGFSRQEYWSGLSCPPPGDLPDPRIKSASPALIGRFFTTPINSFIWIVKHFFFQPFHLKIWILFSLFSSANRYRTDSKYYMYVGSRVGKTRREKWENNMNKVREQSRGLNQEGWAE